MVKEIPLTKGKHAIVDDEDYDHLNRWKWCVSGTGYARRGRRSRKEGWYIHVMMHQQIMGFPEAVIVDHMNGNPLDNRRSNLRLATYTLNQANARKQVRKDGKSTSQFKGVSFHKQIGKFEARLTKGGLTVRLGYFASPVDAAAAYNKAALEYFGEFALLNNLALQSAA